MKTLRFSTQRLRTLIRWGTAVAVTAGIILGCCRIFPGLTGCCPALILTGSLAIIIGLQIGLPPLNPDEDWLRFQKRGRKAAITHFRQTETDSSVLENSTSGEGRARAGGLRKRA